MKTQRKVCGFDENDMKTYSCRRGLNSVLKRTIVLPNNDLKWFPRELNSLKSILVFASVRTVLLIQSFIAKIFDIHLASRLRPRLHGCVFKSIHFGLRIQTLSLRFQMKTYPCNGGLSVHL